MQQDWPQYEPSLEMALHLQTVEHCSQEEQSLCTSIHKNHHPFQRPKSDTHNMPKSEIQ